MIRTERLVLRRWTDADRPAFFDLNSDPLVMATIGPVMDRAQSDAMMDRIEGGFDAHGFGLWCVELDGTSIGFTGLSVPWFRDGVEVGWRIRSAWWGHGYAPGSGAGRAGGRVRRPGPRRGDLVHGGHQRQVAPGDGEDRADPRSGR